MLTENACMTHTEAEMAGNSLELQVCQETDPLIYLRTGQGLDRETERQRGAD